MSEQENPVEETPVEATPESEVTNASPAEDSSSTPGTPEDKAENQAEAKPAEASTPALKPAAATPPERQSRGGNDSRSYGQNRRGGRRDDRSYGRDDRRGGRRDDRQVPNNFTAGSIPAEYVRPTYRGRSRRVEGSIDIKDVHYRNIPLLSKFLDPYGRIMSRRKTRVSAKVQRKAVKAIKQARHLCLLPYTGEHMRVARKRRRR